MPSLPPWFSAVTPFRVALVLGVVALGPFVFFVAMMLLLKIGKLFGGGTYAPLPQALPIGQRRNPREGHCIQFVGRLGSGKTSLAVRRAVKLARKHKLPLISNAPIRTDALVVRSWVEIDSLPTCQDLEVECVNGCQPGSAGCHPAVLFLDELHLWYPSSTTLMPKEQQQLAFELLSFARKRGWTVFATTQAPKRVHTGWRQLMTEQYKVSPISRGYLHRAAMIDVEDDGDVLMPVAALFSPFRAQYNTRAEVHPLWSVDDGSGRRRYLTVLEAEQALALVEAGSSW